MTSISSSRRATDSSFSRCAREDLARLVVGVGDDALDFGVDLLGGHLRVEPALLHHRHVEETRALLAFVVDRAERVAHAELGDHRPRDVGGALEVVLRAGRDFAERDLLGGPAAEQHRELAQQVGPRHQVAILERQLHRVAQRAEAALDDRDLVHRIEAGNDRSRRWRGRIRGTRRSRAPSCSSRASSRGPRSAGRSADSRSFISTIGLSKRAASSAASLTRFARSAPAKPAVRAATTRRSTCGDILTSFAWIRRMASRPFTSGLSTTICRSKRPGRSSAGSSTSGRLVAAMMMTPLRRVEPVHLGQQLVERLFALFVAAHRALRRGPCRARPARR